MPTVVKGLAGKQIVGASAGKHHSVVLASDGTCYSFGSNHYGQLAIGSCKSSSKDEELKKAPVLCTVPKCDKVACGAEFTMFLCDGELFSCGLPQYGQLGNGTTGEYNTSASSIKMAFSPHPLAKRILGPLTSQKVVNVACGHNHTCCSDTEGNVYTWGFGGYSPSPTHSLLAIYSCPTLALLPCN
jgi:alpha-tubulin suppressor-like RCC1 family protein